MADLTITSRSTAAVACTVAVLALLSTRGATTQSASGANQQIAVLQRQLSALDRRVKDLEQAATAAAAADQVKPEPANGGKPDATVETRIAQLEAEVRSLQSQEAAGSSVKAPFKVLDASGKKVLLEVAGPADKVRLTVGDPDYGGVTLGIGSSGSGEVIVRTTGGNTGVGLGVFQDEPMGVYVLDRDGRRIEASMTTSQEGGSLQLNTNGKQSVHIDESSIVFYSERGSPLSLFGTKDRNKGYMELNDSGGSKMVEAGMLNSRVGYVLATPYRSSVGIDGNPSVLMGGAGR